MRNASTDLVLPDGRTLTIQHRPQEGDLAFSLEAALRVGTRVVTAKSADGAVPTVGVEPGLALYGQEEWFLSGEAPVHGVLSITPAGAHLESANLLPAVMSKTAVDAGIMPPLGSSALPKSIEETLPPDMRYWTVSTEEEARNLRDHIAATVFGDPDNSVEVVDGQMRLCVRKLHLWEPGDDDVVLVRTPNDVATIHKAESESWDADIASAATQGRFVWLNASRDDEDVATALAGLRKSDPAGWGLAAANTEANRELLRELRPIVYGSLLVATSEHVTGAYRLSPLNKGASKKVVDVQGLKVKIDRPKGFVMTGQDSEGNKWNRTYLTDYGFIPKTDGGDEEELDVFLGPDLQSPKAFLIKQKNGEGKFDELKLMLGFASGDQALKMYLAHVPEKYFDGMEAVSLDLVKALCNVKPGDTGADAMNKAESTIRILKAHDEQFVLGIVLEPDVVDSQNDTYSADEIRKAAHRFMSDYRTMGLMHKGSVSDRVKILESFIAPCDMSIGDTAVKKGTWLMSVRVNDNTLWDSVKKGELTGFSVGGSAIRRLQQMVEPPIAIAPPAPTEPTSDQSVPAN